MYRKALYVLCTWLGICLSFFSLAQEPVVRNKLFSFGSYGRVGVGWAPGITGSVGRNLNLNGMGAVGGRLEEGDYFELAGALHFSPVTANKDTTSIDAQVRFGFFPTQGQLIGGSTSKSFGSITTAIPELYVEAKKIAGSNWSVWVGARYFRGGDIHIADYFYFDDHTSQGFGIKYKNTQFAVMLPGAVDTSSSVPPYFYLNIVNNTPVLGLRGRQVYILEQQLFSNKWGQFKILGEFHKLNNATVSDTTRYNYPADLGFVLGVKHIIPIKQFLDGSFQQFSARYGYGIANGGDGGGSKTFLTYGAPNLQTGKFKNAYSIALTEHFLANFNRNYSLNGYALYTHSKGAADSTNKAPDFMNRQVFNRKTDLAVGFRGQWYITNWFHLLHEANYAARKDGSQPYATMFKLGIIPTIVPTGKRDVWARPQIRLVYECAFYNKFASNNLYSTYLQQSGAKSIGQFIGIGAEWWIW
ncbi:carbohydrate porin [Danxiaibacter flavus]|uniref:Carbohydrate porin n=1 Tax=Danxiaibacter flavus TaxID=3049108 RepID=A0ABV3ZGY8_9BACT|nr:carbohydrate porin [Chitinophagaceae bacterium DXS]